MDEFIAVIVRKKHLNKDIQAFRKEHPNYEVFNIGASGYSELKFLVVWKLKNIVL